MDETAETAAETGVIVLAERLDARATADLIDTLRDRRGSDLRIDTSGTSQITARGAQALMSAARSWATDGNALICGELSEAALADLTLLGLSPDSLSSEGWT